MSGDNHIPNWQLYLIMFLMLVFGTFNTVVLKTQDDVVTNDNATNKYTHPFF